jgi:hypothetical protein
LKPHALYNLAALNRYKMVKVQKRKL